MSEEAQKQHLEYLNFSLFCIGRYKTNLMNCCGMFYVSEGNVGVGGRLFLSCSGFVAVITTLDKGCEGAELCYPNTCLKLNKILNFTGSKSSTFLQRALALLIYSF
jgi:hypothetical protein